MARVQNTLIGRASGSVGEVVFLTWKGINVTRAKPSSVYNPDTIPQQRQRNTFAQTVGLYNALKPILQDSLKTRNRLMTLFNYYQSLIMSNVFSDNGDGTVGIIPEKLVMSKGLLSPLKIINVSPERSPGTSQIDYSTETIFGQNPTDKIHVVIFNKEENLFQWYMNVGTRSAGSLYFNVSPLVGATPFFHIYVFSSNEQHTVWSDTQYFLRVLP